MAEAERAEAIGGLKGAKKPLQSALVLDGQPFHINFGASIEDLRG